MTYDGIVIGGGAAGMFAAVIAARQGAKVLLLEKNDRLGKKLFFSGNYLFYLSRKFGFYDLGVFCFGTETLGA